MKLCLLAAHLLCAAWFLIGHRPVPVCSPGFGDHCSRMYRHHTKHYRHKQGRKVWSLFSKTSQSSWRSLLMKSGLEIKSYASFHHPHVKSSYRVFCSWAEQYMFILRRFYPQCQGATKPLTLKLSLLETTYMTKPLPPLVECL